MLDRVLGKILPAENSVAKILNFDERISEIQNEITVLSNVYAKRVDLFLKSCDTEYADRIKIEHEEFMDEYLKRVGKLRKELNTLTDKRNTLLLYSDIRKAYRDHVKNKFLQSYIDKHRNGEISQNVLSVMMKSVGDSLIRYSDVICYNPYGEFLIIQRANKEDDKNSLLWGIPGGHVDMGETYKQAAAREFFEETGIKVKEEDLILIGEYTDGEKVNIQYYQTYTDEVEPTIILNDSETYDYRWITLREIEKYDMPFNMRENIIRLMGGINLIERID